LVTSSDGSLMCTETLTEDAQITENCQKEGGSEVITDPTRDYITAFIAYVPLCTAKEIV